MWSSLWVATTTVSLILFGCNRSRSLCLVLLVLRRAKDIATFSTNHSGSTGWCSSRNRGGVPKRCQTAWHIETCSTVLGSAVQRKMGFVGFARFCMVFPGCYEHADPGWSKQTAVSFLAWKFGTTGRDLDLVVKNLRQLRTGATLSEALLELGSVWNPAASAGCCWLRGNILA